MKFIFAGGGTGGHVFPAIAIADEIKKMLPDSKILFIGAQGRIEEKLVPGHGYELITISIEGFKRNDLLSNTGLPVKLVGAISKSKKIIKNFNPDVVIGTGGFVSLPVLYAATRLKKSTLIQEGNSSPGLATRFLARKADRVVINFDVTADYLRRKENIIKIGHPVRSSLSLVPQDKALNEFGLESGKFTLFVFGGSQGSRGINSAVELNLTNLLDIGINILWQTGTPDFNRLKEKYRDLKDVRILEFINNMSDAYSAADLVLCRSGVTSIMELAYLGKAVIFVPFPGATDNHQEKNARSLEKENACRVLPEDELNNKLTEEIRYLKSNEAVLTQLRANINMFADPDAAKKIAEEIIKLAHA